VVTQERWERIASLLPSPNPIGRPPVESRLLLTGILWIMRTGAAWRDLPAEYGHWHTAYTRYHDWQQSGLWTQILAILEAPNLGHAL
jgi:transposase